MCVYVSVQVQKRLSPWKHWTDRDKAGPDAVNRTMSIRFFASALADGSVVGTRHEPWRRRRRHMTVRLGSVIRVAVHSVRRRRRRDHTSIDSHRRRRARVGWEPCWWWRGQRRSTVALLRRLWGIAIGMGMGMGMGMSWEACRRRRWQRGLLTSWSTTHHWHAWRRRWWWLCCIESWRRRSSGRHGVVLSRLSGQQPLCCSSMPLSALSILLHSIRNRNGSVQ